MVFEPVSALCISAKCRNLCIISLQVLIHFIHFSSFSRPANSSDLEYLLQTLLYKCSSSKGLKFYDFLSGNLLSCKKRDTSEHFSTQWIGLVRPICPWKERSIENRDEMIKFIFSWWGSMFAVITSCDFMKNFWSNSSTVFRTWTFGSLHLVPISTFLSIDISFFATSLHQFVILTSRIVREWTTVCRTFQTAFTLSFRQRFRNFLTRFILGHKYNDFPAFFKVNLYINVSTFHDSLDIAGGYRI